MKEQIVENLQNEWKIFLKAKRMESVFDTDVEVLEQVESLLNGFILIDCEYLDEFEDGESVVIILTFQQPDGEEIEMFCPPDPWNWEINVKEVTNRYDHEADCMGVEMHGGVPFSEAFQLEKYENEIDALFENWMNDFYARVDLEAVYQQLKEEEEKREEERLIESFNHLYKEAKIEDFIIKKNQLYAVLSNGRKLKISK